MIPTRIAPLLIALLQFVSFTESAPVVDEAFVDDTIFMAEMTIMAKDPPATFPTSTFYRQGVAEESSYMVVLESGTCYAALAGDLPSYFGALFDRILALLSLNFDYMDDFMEQCSVQTPVLRKYEALDNLETDVRDCVATCGAGPCPLQLTGHGTGGGRT